jgi:hypothetical protein
LFRFCCLQGSFGTGNSSNEREVGFCSYLDNKADQITLQFFRTTVPNRKRTHPSLGIQSMLFLFFFFLNLLVIIEEQCI